MRDNLKFGREHFTKCWGILASANSPSYANGVQKTKTLISMSISLKTNKIKKII